MKNKKFFLIPIIAMVLASCNPAQKTSSVSSTSIHAPTTSETISSQEQSSSAVVSSNDVVSSEASAFVSSSEVSSSKEQSSSEQASSSELVSSSSELSSSAQQSTAAISSSEQPSSSSEVPSSSEQLSSSSEISSSSEQSSSSTQQSSSSSSSSSSRPDVLADIEIFAFNDVHGNVKDSTNGIGISKTSTLLKTYPQNVNNALYISQGDMWQGSAESNNTKGKLVTEWMNQVGFTSMTVGNHEFDWSTSYIQSNSQLANFPFLGINIFDRNTDQRVSYLDASVVVEKNGARIGIIGAIGDCYSSISSSMVQDVYFKVGSELTNLVKQEATRLRNEEDCDMIIYSIHDGNENYDYLSWDYDESLSNGYVDLVLEGHTHKNYILQDSYGVYHIQNYANNKSINYINLTVNTGRNTVVINNTETIYTNYYSYLDDDTNAESLFTKYASEIGDVNSVIGYNSSERSSYEICELVADLYLQYGLSKWGSSYNIYLAGGYLSTRSPYDLAAGEVTFRDVSTLLPFENKLVLGSISGYDLKYKFVSTSNSNYHISLSDYGEANSYINYSSTYYIVCDTYTSDYASNNITVIDTYANDFYASHMVAAYIAAGNWA